jgi:hypothetical protein
LTEFATWRRSRLGRLTVEWRWERRGILQHQGCNIIIQKGNQQVILIY